MPMPITPIELLAWLTLIGITAAVVTIVFFVIMIVLGVLADGMLWLAHKVPPGPTR